MVVVGAEAQRATELAVAAGADLVVEASDWAQGQSASLRAGLVAVQATSADVACILLVDLPDVGAAVVERRSCARERGGSRGTGPRGIPRRAGAPGRDGSRPLAGVLDLATGDRGARDYLAAHDHLVVECGDLATGRDVDTPADLDASLNRGSTESCPFN